MALIGYARASSTGQSLEVQLQQLKGFGCIGGENRIFSEKRTGTNAKRPELTACLAHLRAGDTLVITRLDRLARSTNDLTAIVAGLEEKGVNFKVINQDIDTSTPTGKLMFNLLSAIAEFETGIRKERQTDGIAMAKEKGVAFGCKPKLSPAKVAEMKEKRVSGVKIKDLMNHYKLSKASIYRLMSDDNQQ